MSAKCFGKMVVLAVALVFISAGYAWADKAELQAKLSKEVKIRLSDVTIVEALEKIGEKAAVKFVLSDEAVWKLPQAGATRLSVMLDGPLAESMTEMLNAFFMRYAVGDEEITIYPRLELEHVLGKPTAKQLELLKDIYTKPIQVYFLDEVQKSINVALGQEILVSPLEVQRWLHSLLRKFVGEKTVRTEDARGKALTVTRMPGEDLGEQAPKEYNLPSSVTLVQLLRDVKFDGRTAQWYIPRVGFPGQVPEIRVVSSKDFREAKLDQIVDISFKDERAEVIIQRLANWTGMELHVRKREPLWLDEVISVDMQNVKLRQAIRNIVTTVDGEMSIGTGENSIAVWGPKHEKKAASTKATLAARRPSGTPAKAGSEGYVGKISIPMDDGKYYIEFMLREKDLTEELKQLREEKMNEILGQEESEQDVEEESGD